MRKFVTGASILAFCHSACAAALRSADQSSKFVDTATPIELGGSDSSLSSRSACSGNTPSNRTTWCDYDISTNYYEVVPNTGATVEYWFELTNITASPDGYARQVLTVNGSIPGPTIQANWGDTVKVHVTNSLANNGTSLHFHGIRQNYTNAMDGVASITQCPVAPGESITYTWRATQYGSSWYHSHYDLQAWEGVLGGIVINGPSTSNWDTDLGMLFLNDWSHQTVDELYTYAETEGPPTMDNGLINGTNTGDDGGSRFSTSVTEGDTYLLRLVNGAADTHFDFTIDNHTLQVISSDFVPIQPYYTDVLSIGMGQRYDVLVTANMSSAASDFWIRAIPDSYCSESANTNDIKGILHYGSSTGTPNTIAFTYDSNDCSGEDASDIVPYLALDAETSADLSDDLSVTIGRNTDNLYKWYIGGTTFLVDWSNPTARKLMNNETTSFADSNAVIELATADEWYYLIIETTLAVPHPIHLHGHDFWQLASGTGTYASSNATLNTSNPPRRDTAMLPGSGYLVIALKADNPGAWLCHCHIAWHTSEGFALQFVERRDEIPALYDTAQMNSTCSAWDAYLNSTDLEQDFSGV
ncbi:Laccase-3 [Hortaea werneckii]|nr:Laccase-3 [Hortaea werneckii]